MTSVTVRLSGSAAEIVGHHLLEYELSAPATFGTLLELMGIRYPAMMRSAGTLEFTLNGKPAEAQALLTTGDEVVIVPREAAT